MIKLVTTVWLVDGYGGHEVKEYEEFRNRNSGPIKMETITVMATKEYRQPGQYEDTWYTLDGWYWIPSDHIRRVEKVRNTGIVA